MKKHERYNNNNNNNIQQSFLSFCVLLLLFVIIETGNAQKFKFNQPSGIAPDKPIVDNDLYSWYCVGEGCLTTPNPPPTSPQFGLVLMGGSTDVDYAFIWMSQLAAGGDFVILRTSGEGAYNQYIYDLGLQAGITYGSVSTLVLKSRSASFDAFVVELTNNATALWMAGGDQWEYYSYWKGTPLQTAIRSSTLYSQRPFGGTSAGLAIQPMNAYIAQYGSAGSLESLHNPYNEYINFGSGFLEFSLLQNTVTDSHFYERDRMGRLVAFLSRNVADITSPLGNVQTGCMNAAEGGRAIGVDEETALLVSADGTTSITSWRDDGSAYLLCLEVQPERCEPNASLEVTDILTYKISGNLTNIFSLSNWKPLDSSSVVQYSLSASKSILTANGNGGSIY